MIDIPFPDTLKRMQREGRWDALEALLRDHAANAISQGHAGVLLELLDQSVERLGHSRPWFSYWQGRCLLAEALGAAPRHFAAAFAAFNERGDLDGATHACAGLLDALWLLQEDCHDFDPWLEALQQLRQRLQIAGRDDLLQALSRSAFAGLYVRRPDHPDLPYWEELSLQQLSGEEPIAEAMLRGLQLMLHYTWNTGQRGRATLVLETLQSRLGKQQQPGYVLCLYHVVHAAYLLWFSERIEDCQQVVEQGLALSGSLKLPDWDIPLLNSMLYASCAHEDLDKASHCAQRLKERIRLQPRPMDRAIQHHFLAYRAWLEGHPQDALPAIASAVTITRANAYAYPQLLCELAETVLQAETGAPEAALERLDFLAGTARDYRSDNSLYTALMNRAIILCRLERRRDCLQVLDQALEIGARHRYCHIPWLRRQELARLCLLALEEKIQSDYAQYLIRALRLPAPLEATRRDTPWPWSCVIRVLGRIFIEHPGQESSEMRSASSLYRLLLSLVSAGPEGVDVDALVDRLWPEIEGDVAHGRLKISLHRLRRLLGLPAAVRHAHRRVWLEPSLVWVDAWAFERVDDEKSESAAVLAQSLKLYHGHLVTPDEKDPLPWHYARRLADLYAERVTRYAGLLESGGHWQQALSAWRRALAIDPTPEFFEGAIRCLMRLNRPKQAEELRCEYQRWQQSTA